MAHSNRKRNRLLLAGGELLIFAITILTAYFSQNSNWKVFFPLSLLALVIYSVLKAFDTWPVLQEIMVREDLSGRIAGSGIRRGLVDFFDMQNPDDQERRNRVTREVIAQSEIMWLCANSGASYLDPGVYRHWPSIEERLKAGVEFRVVLLDPFSAEKGFRNNHNSGGDAFDSKININNIIKLYNKYSNLDVRFVRYGMHVTVFATSNALFLDPYQVAEIDGRIENRSFCLQAIPLEDASEVGIYRIFKSHLRTLWASGLSLEDWLERSGKNKLALVSNIEIKPRQYTK